MKLQSVILPAITFVAGVVGTYLFLQPVAGTSSDSDPGLVNRAPDVLTRDQPPLDRKADADPAPPSTLAALNDVRSEFQQSLALYQLLDGRSAEQIVELIEEARSTIQGRDYAAATAIMYTRLAELDFSTALRRILRSTETARSGWLRSIFHTAARADLSFAVQQAQALPASMEKSAGRAILASRDDLPRKQREEIAASLGVTVTADTAATSFADAWRLALELPDQRMRAQDLHRIAGQWAAIDPQSALSAMDSLPNTMRMGLRARVVGQWAADDFESAWQWIGGLGPSRDRQMLQQTAMMQLAQTDASRAREIAQTLPGNMRQQAMSQVMMMAAQQDPRAAMAWLNEQPPSGMRMHLVMQMAMGVATKDPELLDEFMPQLSDEEARMVESSMISMMARRNPEESARRIEGMEDAERRRNAGQSLVAQWAEIDHDSAARWVRTQPKAERAHLYGTLASQMAQWDPEGALNFADRLEDNDARDMALMNVLSGHFDFNNANQLVNSIQNPQLRAQAARNIFYRLRQIDPERAEVFQEMADIEEHRTE